MFNYIIINKDNLINNIKQVKANNPNSKICAMVKANAYGVGQTEVVQILGKYVDYFGVACFFEAESIKKCTNKKILIVGPLEKSCVDERFSYACHSLDDVEYLISTNKKINVHLKVNTGMNRFGICSIKEFKTAIKKIKKSNLILEGVFTHFATIGDSPSTFPDISENVMFLRTVWQDPSSEIGRFDLILMFLKWIPSIPRSLIPASHPRRMG